jgi:hypothetical protein
MRFVDKEQRLAIVRDAASRLLLCVKWPIGTHKFEGYVYQKMFTKMGNRMIRVIFDDYPSFVDIKSTGESILPCCVICKGRLGMFGYKEGTLEFLGWYKKGSDENGDW